MDVVEIPVIAGRVAEVALDIGVDGIAEVAFCEGFLLGVKLALEHADAADGVLASFMDMPQSNEERDAFYACYDYIANGKEPV